jgi:hypothetical protein
MDGVAPRRVHYSQSEPAAQTRRIEECNQQNRMMAMKSAAFSNYSVTLVKVPESHRRSVNRVAFSRREPLRP